MSASAGATGLLWLWATVTDLGPAGEPEHPAQAPAAAVAAAGPGRRVKTAMIMEIRPVQGPDLHDHEKVWVRRPGPPRSG